MGLRKRSPECRLVLSLPLGQQGRTGIGYKNMGVRTQLVNEELGLESTLTLLSVVFSVLSVCTCDLPVGQNPASFQSS
jgi:hypothetical protein